MSSVHHSIRRNFPGRGIDAGLLHQESSGIAGFLAINAIGDDVEFMFDAEPEEAARIALESVVANHDHPVLDIAAILQLIQS